MALICCCFLASLISLTRLGYTDGVTGELEIRFVLSSESSQVRRKRLKLWLPTVLHSQATNLLIQPAGLIQLPQLPLPSKTHRLVSLDFSNSSEGY